MREQLKLTDNQKRLVEENHNLIYSCMHKFGIKLNEFDDYYGDAAIALCNAAIHADEKTGKFSTFAYKCIENELRRKFNYENRQKRKTNKLCSSYDELIGYDTSKLNLISSNENLEKNMIMKLNFESEMDVLTNRQRNILLMYGQGYTLREIGKVFNISFQAVSFNLVQIRKKLRKFDDLIDDEM